MYEAKQGVMYAVTISRYFTYAMPTYIEYVILRQMPFYRKKILNLMIQSI